MLFPVSARHDVRVSTPRRCLALAVAVVAAVCGCGAGSNAEPRRASLQPRGTPTSSPPSAVTHAPSPRAWRSVGDIDGDHRPDQARAVDLHKMFPIEEERTEVYRLDVRLADGARESVQFGADRSMPGEPTWMRTQVIGGSDVDGDGL